ncbi:MAG: hypothetical protein A2Y33_16570 [Spirochaetes bacterium GWF1_51_8]|nr:MAG: hypothetical protein A2Y33_16570 [Spirochaetes bacterium GWF1_51_8]
MKGVRKHHISENFFREDSFPKNDESLQLIQDLFSADPPPEAKIDYFDDNLVWGEDDDDLDKDYFSRDPDLSFDDDEI